MMESISSKPVFRKIPLASGIVAVIGLLFTFFQQFLSGFGLAETIIFVFGWIYAYLYFVIFYKTLTGVISNPKLLIIRHLAWWFFLNPLSNCLIFSSILRFPDGSNMQIVIPDLLSIVELVLLGTVSYLFIKGYILFSGQISTEDNAPERTKAKNQAVGDIAPETMLGNGTSDIDPVIGSIVNRALASSRMTVISLVVMIILVFVGGGASMGSQVFDNFENYRQLNVQLKQLDTLNKQLISFQDSLRSRKTLTDSTIRVNNALVRQLSKVNMYIKQRYRNDEYQKAVTALQKPTEVHWQEIALRATIALLTLFLVQVFFNIYKYNQQQTSHLYSKAETIELFRNAETEKKSMRKSLFSKMEPAPKFDKGPTPPTEQIVNILKKTKD